MVFLRVASVPGTKTHRAGVETNLEGKRLLPLADALGWWPGAKTVVSTLPTVWHQVWHPVGIEHGGQPQEGQQR